uniref:Ankyrin repeat-containing protein n=1 Tax=Spironucleus salmonicida TaxID=348837 RepID=V6LQY7_9EUKA|eukprot:EST47092.1 Ankyrin repeat-containing protein [Spironucleus salmonicida]
MSNATSWFTAARTGDCRYILQHKQAFAKTVDSTFPHSSALILAAQSSQTPAAKLLLPSERGMQNKHGWSALHFAAYQNNQILAKLLAPFENNLKTSSQFKNIPPGASAAQVAAISGNNEILSIFGQEFEYLNLPFDLSLSAERDNLGRTKLHYYAVKGQLNNFQDENSAFIKVVDNQQKTALMIAAESGNISVVQALINYESGIQGGIQGNTALMIAIENKKNALVQILAEKEAKIQNQVGLTAMMLAAKDGNLDAVKLLVDQEKRIQTSQQFNQFPAGTTALMLAEFYGRNEVVVFLKDHEQDLVNSKNQTYKQIEKLSSSNVRQYSPRRNFNYEVAPSNVLPAQQSNLINQLQNSNGPKDNQLEITREVLRSISTQNDNSEVILTIQEKLGQTKEQMATMEARLQFKEKEISELKQFVHMKPCESCKDKQDIIREKTSEIEVLKKDLKEVEQELRHSKERIMELSVLADKQQRLELQLQQIYDSLINGDLMNANSIAYDNDAVEKIRLYKDEIYNLKAENLNLTDRVNNMNQELIQLKDKIEHLEQENKELMEQNLALKSQIPTDMAEQLEELIRENEDLKDQLASFQATQMETLSSAPELQSELTTLKEQVEQLKQADPMLLTRLNNDRQQLAALKNELAQLDPLNEVVEENMEPEAAAMCAADNTADELTNQLAAISVADPTAPTQAAEIERQIADLTKSVEALKGAPVDLPVSQYADQAELAALREELEQLRAAPVTTEPLAAAESADQDLAEKLAASEQELTALKEELEQLRAAPAPTGNYFPLLPSSSPSLPLSRSKSNSSSRLILCYSPDLITTGNSQPLSRTNSPNLTPSTRSSKRTWSPKLPLCAPLTTPPMSLPTNSLPSVLPTRPPPLKQLRSNARLLILRSRQKH